MKEEHDRYRWIGLGDINGFCGLMFDNVAVLSFLAGALILGFGFPADVVYRRMFPGTAFGVLFGDLVYTWMAFRLAKRTGSRTVTAMPLGLDTPSSIGLAVAVLGPAFVALTHDGHTPEDAAMLTWYIGMATMVMIGVVKVVLSFCGSWVQKAVPRAGLLGSLAGVGLVLIGFMPLADIFELPVVGMISLGLMFSALVARVRLPKNIPGVLAAIVVGTVLYHVYHLVFPGWLAAHPYTPPVLEFHVGMPWPTLDFVRGIVPALKFLPISIPFAILTVVGGINNTESARVAGDDYGTRQILLTEAYATLVAGLCGGIAQSTPYIGHPAYKRMGARAGYTLMTGIFIGLGGMLGYISFFVELIPRAVLAPILVFIGLEITNQAFLHSPARHASAVGFAMLPTVARLLSIKFETPEIVSPANLQLLMSKVGSGLPEMLVTVALGNGFILTGMLWGAFLSEMIDHRLRASACYLAVLAVFTFFGIVHSALPQSNVYLPWLLTGPAQQIPYQFTLAYLVLALMILALSFTPGGQAPVAAVTHPSSED
jgi:adenine/guanine/hypoxanthine permease